MDGRTVGIDFGTTNSCIAVWVDGKPVVIPYVIDQRILPSVVTFIDEMSDPAVGFTAIAEGKRVPEWRHDRVKLLMGKRWNRDEDRGGKTVESPADSDGATWTWLRGPGRNWSPSQVAAFLFITMLDAAEAFLGEPAGGVVVTVPDGFLIPEREAVKQAAVIAGIPAERITLLEEPTAAALAHGYALDKFATVAVYDFGGGTFDISFIQAGKKGVRVLGTNGNSRLGGYNFDQRLKQWAIERYAQTNGVDLASRPQETLDRILEAAEETKKHLSDIETDKVFVEFVDNTGPTPGHLDIPISRVEFEDIVRDLVDESIDICRDTMKERGILKTDIDVVILVGGMTHVPLVRRKVEEFFGKKPLEGVNPKEVVALGAAIRGAQIDGVTKKMKFANIVSHSIGFETLKNRFVPVIPKGTQFPLDGSPIKETVVLTSARDDQPKLSVYVRQGGDLRADRNVVLGRHHFEIPAMPAGEPSLPLTFTMDGSGNLVVETENQVIVGA